MGLTLHLFIKELESFSTLDCCTPIANSFGDAVSLVQQIHSFLLQEEHINSSFKLLGSRKFLNPKRSGCLSQELALGWGKRIILTVFYILDRT
jgi:hypothetical protein